MKGFVYSIPRPQITARRNKVRAAKILGMFVDFAGFYEDDPQLAQHILLETNRRFHDNCDEVCNRWDDLGVRIVADTARDRPGTARCGQLHRHGDS